VKGLGKDFNVVALADTLQIDLTDALGVTFVCYGVDVYTLTQDNAAGDGPDPLTCINDFYASDGVGAVWTHEIADDNGALADNDNVDDSADCVVIHVDAADLADGMTGVICTATATGVVTAILHSLAIQRAPENLPSPVV